MQAEQIFVKLFYLGLIIAFFGVGDIARVKYLTAHGTTVDSKVVFLIQVEGDDGGYTYKPVFEYKDGKGKLAQYTSNVSSNPPAYKVNDEVELVYDTEEPSKIRVKTFWGLHRGTIIALIIAMPLIIFGGGFILYDSRWNQFAE